MIKMCCIRDQCKVGAVASPPSSTSSSSSSIFLGVLGVGLSILFCTSFCRACHRYRETQIEREAWRRTGHDGQPPSIYFIPFAGNISHLDAEDPRDPRYSQDHQPPQYSAVSYGPPPAYNEVSRAERQPPREVPEILLLKCVLVIHSWDSNPRTSPLPTHKTTLLCFPSHPHLTRTRFNHKHNNNRGPSQRTCANLSHRGGGVSLLPGTVALRLLFFPHFLNDSERNRRKCSAEVTCLQAQVPKRSHINVFSEPRKS